MRLLAVILAVALSFGLMLGAAQAQGTAVSLGVSNHDASAPVEITSTELELSQNQGLVTFNGDVLVRQGQMTLTSQKLLVEYSDNPDTGQNDIETIRMFGGVTFATPSETAEAAEATYDVAGQRITMFGDVLVTQGRTALTADRLTFNVRSGNGRLTGNVKTILQRSN